MMGDYDDIDCHVRQMGKNGLNSAVPSLQATTAKLFSSLVLPAISSKVLCTPIYCIEEVAENYRGSLALRSGDICAKS